MNILNYTEAETYLTNKQVYFRKEIANSDLKTIADANVVHKVGKVKITDTSNSYHSCKAISIEINGVETTIYEYKTDLELFAWLKINLIPLNELVDNYLKCEQLVSKCACDNADDIQPYYDMDDDIFRCDKCDRHFC